jgi:Dynein heavy chain AAA lid domain
MSLGSKMSKNSKKSEAKEKLLTASARAGLPLVMLELPFLIPAQSIETIYIDATSADTMYGATDEHGTWCDGIAMRRLRAMVQGTADIYTAAGNRGIYTNTSSATATAAKKSDSATTDDKKVKTTSTSTASKSSSSSKLLVLDGNVSAVLESMLSSDVFTVHSIVSPVSAASDNRRLSMPDGTWLSLTSQSHVAIETPSVAHLSPNTLTAVAIVFIEPARDEMIEGLVSAWLLKLNASSNWSDTVKQTLTEALAHRQLYAVQQHDGHTDDSISVTHHYSDPLHAMSVVPYSACFTVNSTTGTRCALQYNDDISPSIALNRIRSMLLILEGMLDWYKEEQHQQQQYMADVVSTTTGSDASNKPVALQTYMLYVYAVTWGIGGHLSTTSARHSFSDYIKAQMPQHVKAHLSKDSSISLYDTVVDLKRAMLVSTETVMMNMNCDTALIGIPRGIWSSNGRDMKHTSYNSSASLTSAPPLCNTMIEATSRVRGVGTALLHFTTYMGLDCVLQGASGSGKTCLVNHILRVASRDCPNPNNIANINITTAKSSSSLNNSSTGDSSLAVLKQLRDTMVSKGTHLIQETAASSIRRQSVTGDTAMMCKNALTKLLSNTDAITDSHEVTTVTTSFRSTGTAAAAAAVTASAVPPWTTNSSVYINASAYGGVTGDQTGMVSVIESALQRECSSKMQAPPGCSSCIIVIDDAHIMNDCASETLRGVIDGLQTITTATASSSSSKTSTKPGSSANAKDINSKRGKLPNRVQIHPDYIGHAAQCDSYSDVRATRIIAAAQYIDSTSRLWQQFVHLSLEEPDVHELTTVFNTALLQTFVGDRRSAYMHSSSSHDGSSSGTDTATLVYNSDVMSAITRVGRVAIKILQLLSDSEKTDGHTNKYINYPTLLRLVKPFELANPKRITTVPSVLRMVCHEILREVVEPYTSISTSEGTNCNTNTVTSAVKCMLSVIQQEASTMGIDTDQFDRLAVTLHDACKQSDSTSNSNRVPFLWTDINGLLALQVLDSINSKRSILKSAHQNTATRDKSTISSTNNSIVAYNEVSSASDEFGLTLDSNSGRFVVSNGVILNSKNLYGIKALTVWLEYAIQHHSTVLQWPLYTQAQNVNGSVTATAKPIITQEDVCNVMKFVRQLALPNNNSIVALDDSRGMRIEGGISCITSLATLLQGSTLYTIDGCVSHVTLSHSKHSTTAATISNLLLATSSSSSSSNQKASDILRQAIAAALTQYNAAASRGIRVLPNKTVILVTNAAHLLTTHSSSILRALHTCDVRDLFTDDELYKLLNNSKTNQSSDDKTVTSTNSEPATRYRIDRVYSTVVSILRQCMTVIYCMSEDDRHSLLMSSSSSTNNSYYAAAIVRGCTVMRLATWSSISQRYFTASNEVLMVARQPLNATASSSMSHVHLTGQLLSYSASTSISGTAAAAQHEHVLAALADTAAVTVPQLYSSWMKLVSNDVIQAVLSTISVACTEAYSALHLKHLQPLKSSELLVRAIDMYKHLCMIGATRLATRSAVLRKVLANVDDWCIKGKGLTKQAQHIKALRAQYDKSIADLKDESAIVEAKKEAIVSKFTKQKADIDEVRSKLVQRQARVADILSPVTKLYENAASCIQQIRDDHLEALCSMSYGAQGNSDSDIQHHDDNGNVATAAVSTDAASDSQSTSATVVTQSATSHLSGAAVHKPQQDSNTVAKTAAAHTEMLLILESLAILMGYRTAYSDAIVSSTSAASADTATDNSSSSNSNSHNSVSLVMRTFLMDPALTAKIEMFDTTADRNKPALQVVMSMFEQRGSSSSSSSSNNKTSPLLSAQPPSTASSGRKSMRTGRTSVLQQVKQSPAVVYARSLATRCSELINRSTALGVLTQFLSAVVVLFETQSECAAKTAAIDIEMKAVADNEATITRSYRESTASVVALQESIALRKQEVALKLGDVRGRMPLLLDIQGMESGLNDAIGMCRKELSDIEQIAITWPGDCISFSAAICAGISALPYNHRQSILHAARATAVRLGCPVSIANTSSAARTAATATVNSSTTVAAAAQHVTNSCQYDLDTADNNADNEDYDDDKQRNNDSFDNNSANDNASNDNGEFPSINTYRYSDFCMGSMTYIEQIQSWVTANIHDKPPVTATTSSTTFDGDSTSSSNAEVHDVSVLAAGVSSLFGMPFEAAYVDAALLTLATTAIPLLIDPYGIGFKWLAKIYASSIMLPAVPAARVVSTMIQNAQQCGSILVVNAIESGLHIDLLTYLVHTGTSNNCSVNSAIIAASQAHSSSTATTTAVHEGFRLILLGRDMPAAVLQSTDSHQAQSSLMYLHESAAAMHAVQVIRFDYVVPVDTSGTVQQEQSIADARYELVTCSAYLKQAHEGLVDVLSADESVFAPKGSSSIESAKQLHTKGSGVTYTETLSRLAEQLFAFKATLERSEAQISNCQTKIASLQAEVTSAAATTSSTTIQQQVPELSVRCAVRVVAARLHDAIVAAQGTAAAQLCDMTSYAILQAQAAALACSSASDSLDMVSTQQSVASAVTAFCKDVSSRLLPQFRWLVVVSALTVLAPNAYSGVYWQAVLALLYYNDKQMRDIGAVSRHHDDSTAAHTFAGISSDDVQAAVALPPERQLTVARAACTIRELLGDTDTGVDDDMDDNNDTSRNARLFTDISTSGAASKHQAGNGSNSNDISTPAYSWDTTFKRPLSWAVPTTTTAVTVVLSAVPPYDGSTNKDNSAVLRRAWVLECIMSSCNDPVFKGLTKHIKENYTEWSTWATALKNTKAGEDSTPSSNVKAVLTSSPWPSVNSSTAIVHSMMLALVVCPTDMSHILHDGDVLQSHTDSTCHTTLMLSTQDHIAAALPDVGNTIVKCGSTKPLNVIIPSHTDWHFCTVVHDIEAAAITRNLPLSVVDGSKPLDVRVPRGVVAQPYSAAATRATTASNTVKSGNSGGKVATHSTRQTASDKSLQCIVTSINMSRSPWDILQEAYREGHWVVILNSNAALNDQLVIVTDAMNRHRGPVTTAHRTTNTTATATHTTSHTATAATAAAADTVESETTDTGTTAESSTTSTAAAKPPMTNITTTVITGQRSSAYGVNIKEIHHTCICPVSQLHRKLQGHGGTLPHRLIDVALNVNRILSASTTSAAAASSTVTALSHKHQQHTLNTLPHPNFRLIVLTPATQVLHANDSNDIAEAPQVCMMSIGSVQWWQRDATMAVRHGQTSVLADLCLKSLRKDLGTDNTALLQFSWCHQAVDGLATRTASYLTTKQLLLQPTTQQRLALDALSSSNTIDMRVCAEVICGLECHKAVEQSRATSAGVTKRSLKQKDSKSGSVQHSRGTSAAHKSSVHHDTNEATPSDNARASCSSTAQGTPLNELLATQLMAVACAVSPTDSPV